MNPLRCLLCLTALVGLLPLAGCLNNTPDGANSRKIVEHAVLDARQRKAQFAVKIAAELKVLLPITAGPEYSWQLAANDPRVLRQTSSIKVVNDEAGNNGVITFESLRPGRSALRFVYIKTDEKETDAIARYDVAITVKP